MSVSAGLSGAEPPPRCDAAHRVRGRLRRGPRTRRVPCLYGTHVLVVLVVLCSAVFERIASGRQHIRGGRVRFEG
jgi:hypothetical protein